MRPSFPAIATILLAALALAACGGDPDRTADLTTSATRTGADTTTADVPARPRTTQCHAMRSTAGPLPRSTDLRAFRDRTLTAAERATRIGHRFTIDLGLRAGRLSIDGTMFGRRTPDNASAVILATASSLLPDVALRIVDDQLYVQADPVDGPWRAGGSASGVSLDVGRELLDHPFLLTTSAAAGDEHRSSTTFDAPPAELRAYATTERRGPVTDLLRGARSLRLVADVQGGRLVGDRFTLDTTVPASLARGPIRAGTRVRITGATTYCPLRTIDRAPISAPRVTR